MPEEGTWESISQTHRDLTILKATPSGQSNIHARPVGKFQGSVPLSNINHPSDTLVEHSRWGDSLVELEVELVLGKDDRPVWYFVDKYRNRMKLACKRNMNIIAVEEKATFGRNIYFRLVEHSLYQEPTWEGDFTVAHISTSSDKKSISSNVFVDGPGHVSVSSENNIERKNVKEYSYNHSSQNKNTSDKQLSGEDKEDKDEDQQQQHVKDEHLVYLDNHALPHVAEN